MIRTVADLASALEDLGDVRNVDESSFDLRCTDVEPARWFRVEVTQEDLEARLKTLRQGSPQEAWANVGAEEAAGRLLTIHIEEATPGFEEGIDTIIVSGDGISGKKS